jgi:hypothetical protein
MTDRGAVFGEKRMVTFAGINMGVKMPVIDRYDDIVYCALLVTDAPPPSRV